MIEISELTDGDVCRRIVWETGAGEEQQGYLLSWWKDRIIIAIEQPGTRHVKPIEVAPKEVRWLKPKQGSTIYARNPQAG